METILISGCSREAGAAPNSPRITSLCSEEPRACGTQGGAGECLTHFQCCAHTPGLVARGGLALAVVVGHGSVRCSVLQEKPMSPVKANPLPHFGVPFLPKLPEKTQVEVCPFSFEAREQERLALKEKRLEEMRNEVVNDCQNALKFPHDDCC